MYISIFLHTYMHPHIYLSKAARKQNAYTHRFSIATTTTRHQYYIRSNKSKIKAEYEADNAAVCESLAQVQGEMNIFRGNMETILEILQSQRNLTSTAANVTHAAGVTNPTTAARTTVETLAETVVPNSGNRQMVPVDSVRLVAAYPWGMLPHLAASLAHGGISSLIRLSLPLLLLETLVSRGVSPMLKLLWSILLIRITTKVRFLMTLLTPKRSFEARTSIFRFPLRPLKLRARVKFRLFHLVILGKPP